MATIADGTKIRVQGDDDDRDLVAGDDDIGRVRGSRIEVGDLTVDHVTVSERGVRTLVVGGRRPVLRLDPAGRKATWLNLSRTRTRLARQKYRPFLRRWLLTRDVEGPAVLTVSQTPLGTSVSVEDRTGLEDEEVEALVAGALAVVLDVPAAARDEQQGATRA